MLFPKILLLLPSVLFINISLTPPHPPPDESERVHGSLYERLFTTLCPILYRVSVSLPCIAEVAVLLAAHYPSALSSEVLSRLVLSGRLPSTHVNGYLLAGASFTMAGALGRLWCFRSMGRHFTHELAMRKDHALVTTGPYAIVRHPSYLCAVLCTLGMPIMIAGPGSFMQRCGWLETTFGRLIVGMPAVVSMLSWVLIFVRCPMEDAFLRERFRGEWDVYSRRVRYWMIPGVI